MRIWRNEFRGNCELACPTVSEAPACVGVLRSARRIPFLWLSRKTATSPVRHVARLCDAGCPEAAAERTASALDRIFAERESLSAPAPEDEVPPLEMRGEGSPRAVHTSADGAGLSGRSGGVGLRADDDRRLLPCGAGGCEGWLWALRERAGPGATRRASGGGGSGVSLPSPLEGRDSGGRAGGGVTRRWGFASTGASDSGGASLLP